MADQGFLERGHKIIFGLVFKKCMKLKKNGPNWEEDPQRSLNPRMVTAHWQQVAGLLLCRTKSNVHKSQDPSNERIIKNNTLPAENQMGNGFQI